MTEYDYSPEAYEKFMATQARIAKWVDNTESHAHEFQSPVPRLSKKPHTLKRRRSVVAPSAPHMLSQPNNGVPPYPPMVYASVPGPMPSPTTKTTFAKPHIYSPSPRSPPHRMNSADSVTPSMSASMIGIKHQQQQQLPPHPHFMFQSPPPSPLATPPPPGLIYASPVSPIYSYPPQMTYSYPPQSPSYVVIPPQHRKKHVLAQHPRSRVIYV